MDKILFWNTRGAGGDDFSSVIVDLVKMHDVDLLIICEPRIQFSKAKRHLLSIGFTDFVVEEATGFSGAIWILWNKNKVQLQKIDSNSQSITVKVSGNGIGDFNELVAYADKNGGSYAGKFGGLRDWVQSEAMIDLGYQGANFTWSSGRIKERLDRGFCNTDWRLLFAEARVIHLAKTKSDHCPLLLRLQPHVQNCRINPPFRFHSMWMQHEEYKGFVTTAWNNTVGNLLDKTNLLASELNTWNKDVFGNIFKKKRRLLARIAGIQKKLCVHDNPFLLNLEKELIKQYELVRDQEAMLWKQKSREKWIQDGDRNTKYFHITTMVRRRKNKIDGLFDDSGGDTNCSENLVAPVSLQEIRSALFSIGGLKAPGFDGFPAAFFQNHWDLCKVEIINLVTNAFLQGQLAYVVRCTSFQVILNGDLSEKFTAGRGIRQGDPLSPYIFVLCMEKLSHLIQSAIEVGQWKPIKSSQSGPLVSHLFFADDLILFAEASTNQARVLKKCMDLFCSISGQSVNFEKSKIYCSPNVRTNLARAISGICGSPLTKDLGKYLGVPLLHSRVTKLTYSEMIDKVHGRLCGWKSKTLSMAGRLTLINSVTASIPIYTMQTAKIPLSTCDALDKLNRDFLWGDSDDKRKIHLVNWDNVCKPKNRGGLGIKRTTDMNKAMLAKVSWRILQNDDGFWCNLYKAKYLKHVSVIRNLYKPPDKCSTTWRSICSGATLLRQGIIWRIGDGGTARFWTDHWSSQGILAPLAIDRTMVDPNLLVQDFWNGYDWDITMVCACLPPEIAAKIICIPIDNVGRTSNKMIWKPTHDGKFSVKSAYNSIVDDGQPISGLWKGIWSFNIHPKLKIFNWLFVRGRDCPMATTVWKEIGMPATIIRTFKLDWNSWITAKLLQKNWLQIAIELKIKHITVETDSATLLNLMMSADIDLHPLGTLLSNCKIMLTSFESYFIQYIHREQNMVADGLAKISIDQEIGLCRCPSIPPFVYQAVMDDIDGISRPRTFMSS
ncbi:uncharacterized protein LOC112194121 [Rosa chinensis]|uniref:uncharacterized protein LOC112194121 n=1 Tax=Rosa chinensis TaxID=74649 RepID=UPI000D092DB2|nr:uncharacterized protein LOC112194121 [Rosa chinensis]